MKYITFLVFSHNYRVGLLLSSYSRDIGNFKAIKGLTRDGYVPPQQGVFCGHRFLQPQKQAHI